MTHPQTPALGRGLAVNGVFPQAGFNVLANVTLIF